MRPSATARGYNATSLLKSSEISAFDKNHLFKVKNIPKTLPLKSLSFKNPAFKGLTYFKNRPYKKYILN